MNTFIKNEIIKLARNNPNEEICGYIYHKLGVPAIYQCTNYSTEISEDIDTSINDYFECMKLGSVIATYHSHPNGPSAFSENDLAAAEEMALPSYVYDVINNEWLEYIPPSYTLPEEGREFIWGLEDCYASVRRYFRQHFNIYLSDFDRDESFAITDTRIMLDNYEKEGFVLLPSIAQIKEHDVLLFETKRAHTQHLGVFRGRSMFFHHPLGALSRTDMLDGSWLKRLKYVIRHRNLS